MHENLTFDKIVQLENKLAKFTGAPYVIATDCCTHAIELALRVTRPKSVKLTAFTYLCLLYTSDAADE